MRKLIKFSALLAILVVIAIPIAAQTVTTYFTLTGVDATSCTPGNPVFVSFNYGVAAGDVSDHIWTLTNPRTGTSNGPVTVGPFNGPIGPEFFSNITINTVPDGTLPDDVLIQEVVATSNIGAGTTSTLVFDCTTGLAATLPMDVTVQGRQPVFFDGRINNYDTGNPVVVYGHDFENGRGLTIYDTDGVLLLQVTPAEIAAADECSDSNTLISSNGAGVSVYSLAGTCDYQVNAPTAEAGKTYILIFPELFPDAGYTSYEE